MQDPEFEKEVRDKMNELKFSPSESVWTSVHRQIARDKRRRPLFWIYIPAGLMVAGGLYFFLHQGIPFSRKGKATEQAMSSLPVQPSPGLIQPHNELTKNDDHANTSSIQSQSNKKTSQNTVRNLAFTIEKNGVSKKLIQGDKKQLAEPGITLSIEENKNSKPGVAIAANQPTAEGNRFDDKPAKLDSSVVSLKKVIQNESPAANQHQKQDDNSGLSIGFTADAGMSNVFSSQVTTQTLYSAYALSANPITIAAAPGLSHGPSATQPGFSYSAGFVAEKKISKKFLLSFGLNYRYYSASLKTGNKIDSSTGYYAWGNSSQYVNRYHFLELPISLGYKVNASKEFPMYVEAGLTVSEMLGGNALQYDYLSGVYFESKNSFSKTQLLVNASYLFGLLQKGIILKVGPQIQYALTNLGGSSSIGKEHLFFAGIKFIVLPKK